MLRMLSIHLTKLSLADLCGSSDDWILRRHADSPQQGNGCDCGVFVCLLADMIGSNIPITRQTFTQNDIDKYNLRLKIGTDVLRGRVTY